MSLCVQPWHRLWWLFATQWRRWPRTFTFKTPFLLVRTTLISCLRFVSFTSARAGSGVWLWTCAASAGSTCPASAGSGNIDATFAIAGLGRVTYNASLLSCASDGATLTNVAKATVRTYDVSFVHQRLMKQSPAHVQFDSVSRTASGSLS